MLFLEIKYQRTHCRSGNASDWVVGSRKPSVQCNYQIADRRHLPSCLRALTLQPIWILVHISYSLALNGRNSFDHVDLIREGFFVLRAHHGCTFSCGSRRTQFIARLIEFADEYQISDDPVYYPPNHSRYNQIATAATAIKNNGILRILLILRDFSWFSEGGRLYLSISP